ncbi:MAG: hypothetical protein WC325_02780 [Candidatus Bathyarchaeia archaeon]|jgi:hypothetical protein
MELSEQRLIGSLFLLAGITCLAAGLFEDQFTTVVNILGEVLKAAIAG